MDLVINIAVFLIAAVIFTFVGIYVRKKTAESKIHSAENEANKIIEMAAIVADGTEIKFSWSVLIKQDSALPSKIVELTHITDEMLECGIGIGYALKQLSDIVEGKVVVCFNKNFDITFLEREFIKNNLEVPFGKVIDALVLARKRIRDIDNYKLGSLAEYFGIPHEQHRALPDCKTLYKVFLKLNEK